MIGLTLGDWHTYKNFGLRMLSFHLSAPEIYEEKVDIPGRNGPLDLSEALTGEPVYQNRTLKAVFNLHEPDLMAFRTRMSNIRNCIHGKMLKIIDDEDQDYHYEGRINVEYKEKNPLFYEVTISADVAPFKLKNDITTVSSYVSGTKDLTCENSRMSIVPTITCTSNFTFKFGDTSVTVAAGTYTFPDIKFVEGSNVITCIGTGTVTITYQEGAL